uniref:Uncharacterized protein n=1 Tax=Manihot esculenta TaxID=3983 RepID=A0A2C9UUC9_MANES
MRWNTPTVRGMLQQVLEKAKYNSSILCSLYDMVIVFNIHFSLQLKRLVVIETEEMYKARKQNVANHQALRPPLVVNHSPAHSSNSP